jgi:hypothetical protein
MVIVILLFGWVVKPLDAADRLPGHRHLFNGDCTFLFGDHLMSDPAAKYDKQTLHRFIDTLADCGVDTYVLNPTTQVPWYPSKRTPNILTGYRRGDREFFRRHYRTDMPKDRLDKALTDKARFLDRYLDLAEAGVNWVDEISRACRRRKLSPWLSIRMNDMHGANSWEGSFMNCALQRDPKYRLSGREVNPRDGVNRMLQALNYRHQEVRDYMMLMIRELVEEHDFEGLELDWLRCPFCMDPPASAESVEIMTRWTADIRRLTQTRAKQIGKPYPLGLRIPCRLGLLKAIGLDVRAMAQAGIIDFVSFSNFWQTSWDVPYDELRRELGERVAIYGVIEDAPNWMHARDAASKQQSYRLLSASPELLRGNAAGKLALGVDGIETFNFFCSEGQARYSALRGLDQMARLRGQTKHYTLASMNGEFMFPLWEFAEQVPAVLEPHSKRAFRLAMAREPPETDLELVIQVVVEKTENSPDLGVSFNGSWPTFAAEQTDRLLFPTGIYTHHTREHRALNYRARVSDIRDGWNEVLVINGSRQRATAAERSAHSARIVSVELAVRKP